MYYKTAWWREKGLNGQIWDPEGPILYTLDDCSSPFVPTSQQGDQARCSSPEHPALMGFLVADNAKDWSKKTRLDRQNAIALQYAKLFKCQEALDYIEYVEHDWNAEEFIGGGCVDIPKI
eukprot:11909988-Ditylum_brightwellii.AAC.1